jgi:hypothetical protein
MGKKLFRVKVILYVMAENESEACVAATTARFDIFECAARKAEQLDPGWNNAVPYNSEDYRTCAEIIADQQRDIYFPDAARTYAEQTQARLQTLADYFEAQPAQEQLQLSLESPQEGDRNTSQPMDATGERLSQD